jgi:hypothetical protein
MDVVTVIRLYVATAGSGSLQDAISAALHSLAKRVVPGSCWARDLHHRAFSESRVAKLDDAWEADDFISMN